MNLRDAMYFVEDIMVKNHFNLLEEGVCFYTNEEKINSMQNIFKLNDKSDFTYLYAVSELLSVDYENINNYLLKENDDSSLIQNIKEPTRNDKLLVATAFRENPEFFSMAWNWVAIVTAELANKSIYKNDDNIIYIDFQKYQKVMINRSILVPVAGTKKTNNITTLTVDPIGELQILGNDYLGFITFAIFLKPEYQKLMFRVVIKYEIDNKEYSAEIKKDTTSEQKTISPEKPEYVDFSKGVKIKSIEWNPME